MSRIRVIKKADAIKSNQALTTASQGYSKGYSGAANIDRKENFAAAATSIVNDHNPHISLKTPQNYFEDISMKAVSSFSPGYMKSKSISSIPKSLHSSQVFTPKRPSSI